MIRVPLPTGIWTISTGAKPLIDLLEQASTVGGQYKLQLLRLYGGIIAQSAMRQVFECRDALHSRVAASCHHEGQQLLSLLRIADSVGPFKHYEDPVAQKDGIPHVFESPVFLSIPFLRILMWQGAYQHDSKQVAPADVLLQIKR
jgi:hypothetical protein